MQNRMKQHPMTEAEVSALLERAGTATFATIGADGYPYAIPVHFVTMEGAVYLHGLPKGEKLDNIAANPKTCLTVYEMQGLIDADAACDTNTRYESAVLRCTASVLDMGEEKTKALDVIVAKYTPQHAGNPLPENMVKGTAVIKLTVDSCTGKYYR